MTRREHFVRLGRPKLRLAAVALVCLISQAAFAGTDALEDLLTRTGKQVSGFLDEFSQVKCTERVTQEKLAQNGKVELREESTYDYLVILTNAGGEISLDESRLAEQAAKPGKKANAPLLVSNGFATLFLVFHPYYAGSFRFTAVEEETGSGGRLSKVHFQHIRGRRSPAALALRGREFPLELEGTAWIDPQTAMIVRIVAGVGSSMEDVGLKQLQSEVAYAPVPFRGLAQTYRFPAQASVEVETQRQHWRNTHRFTNYQRFSVSTEEKVSAP